MRIDERELFKSVMVGFMTDEDPMLAMLKWITEQLMQIEVESKAGANKVFNKYSEITISNIFIQIWLYTNWHKKHKRIIRIVFHKVWNNSLGA